jgi:hypothetical protein
LHGEHPGRLDETSARQRPRIDGFEIKVRQEGSDHGLGGGIIAAVKRAELLAGQTMRVGREDLRHRRDGFDDFCAGCESGDLFGSGSRRAQDQATEVRLETVAAGKERFSPNRPSRLERIGDSRPRHGQENHVAEGYGVGRRATAGVRPGGVGDGPQLGFVLREAEQDRVALPRPHLAHVRPQVAGADDPDLHVLLPPGRTAAHCFRGR